jgi:hypothetical protein
MGFFLRAHTCIYSIYVANSRTIGPSYEIDIEKEREREKKKIIFNTPFILYTVFCTKGYEYVVRTVQYVLVQSWFLQQQDRIIV